MKTVDLIALKDKLYIKYDYIFAKDDYDKLASEIIESIKKDKKIDDVQSIFIEKLSLRINNYVKSLSSNGDKYITLISNFINKYLKINNSYIDSLNEIKKLISFLEEIEFNSNISLVSNLINKNEILCKLLSVIVNQNIDIIKKGKIDTKFKDKILISFIETYSMLNNIEIKEDIDETVILSNSVELYLKGLNKEVLSAEEEKKLFIRYNNGDKNARNIIIEKNLRLVVALAKRYFSKGLEFEDLIEEGNIGLITAVDRFDVAQGYRFSTYAAWWIKQAIFKAIMEKSQSVRYPVHIYDKFINFNNAFEELRESLGREPNCEEIAKKMNITNETAKQLIILKKNGFDTVSLNKTALDEDGMELVDFILDDNSEVNIELERKELHQNVMPLLDKCGLSEREKQVILLRCGFYTDRPLKLLEIGNLLGITRERARQLESRVLRKIVNSPCIKEFATYMYDTDDTLHDIQKIRDFYYQQDNKKYRIETAQSHSVSRKITKKKG